MTKTGVVRREQDLPAHPPGRRRSHRLWERRLLPLALLTPASILIFGLVIYPVARTIWLSFHDAGLAAITSGTTEWIGLDNYIEILGDDHLRRVFVVTAAFGLAAVAGTMVVGVAVALLLNQRFLGRGLLAVIVLLPWAMPRVAAATVWRWMFNDQYGVVNWLLTRMGLDGFAGFPWFNNALPAFVAIGITVVWQSFPFVAISVLAGLKAISHDVVEAARIDGAGPWQVLRHITLPLLKPLLLVLVVISTIWDFKVFDQVFIMTGGGPARSTEVLAIATWREAFTSLEFGLGSALAVLMFLILLGITVVYIRLSREETGIA